MDAAGPPTVAPEDFEARRARRRGSVGEEGQPQRSISCRGRERERGRLSRASTLSQFPAAPPRCAASPSPSAADASHPLPSPPREQSSSPRSDPPFSPLRAMPALPLREESPERAPSAAVSHLSSSPRATPPPPLAPSATRRPSSIRLDLSPCSQPLASPARSTPALPLADERSASRRSSAREAAPSHASPFSSFRSTPAPPLAAGRASSPLPRSPPLSARLSPHAAASPSASRRASPRAPPSVASPPPRLPSSSLVSERIRPVELTPSSLVRRHTTFSEPTRDRPAERTPSAHFAPAAAPADEAASPCTPRAHGQMKRRGSFSAAKYRHQLALYEREAAEATCDRAPKSSGGKESPPKLCPLKPRKRGGTQPKLSLDVSRVAAAAAPAAAAAAAAKRKPLHAERAECLASLGGAHAHKDAPPSARARPRPTPPRAASPAGGRPSRPPSPCGRHSVGFAAGAAADEFAEIEAMPLPKPDPSHTRPRASVKRATIGPVASRDSSSDVASRDTRSRRPTAGPVAMPSPARLPNTEVSRRVTQTAPPADDDDDDDDDAQADAQADGKAAPAARVRRRRVMLGACVACVALLGAAAALPLLALSSEQAPAAPAPPPFFPVVGDLFELTFGVVADGTVDTFDIPSYNARLADVLAVDVSTIETTVAAGSSASW
ncbi:hypothetical protein AB1Y20_013242 [Prymnesium parvum]|uniref:Uncharacterized protein n=1 Tax=Prymnesium parvum TaxID=97485 RepID=A0AB34IK32_PRYPA